MPKHLKHKDYTKVLRLTIGCILSILIAELLHLQFAMSAGILTLLTIQDTKKETVIISLKRLTIFGLMTLFSIIILPNVGYNVWGFAVLLIPYLFCCHLFSMKEAMAPIAVLCTHYIMAKSCSPKMMVNELLLLIIGAGIGIILNLFISNQFETIRTHQHTTDRTIRRILARMSIYLLIENKESYTGACFDELDTLLSSLKKESLQYMNNHFIGSNDYFYHYVQMRLSQCALLKQIHQDIITIDFIPDQAMLLSEVFEQISTEFGEINDAVSLLSSIDDIQKRLQTEPLPTSRKEFESRAVLYHILMDLRLFVSIKKNFAESLSEEDKEQYWNTPSYPKK